MQGRDVAALNIRNPALADPGIDEQRHRAAVLFRRARLAMGCDVFIEEPFPKLAHGRHLGVRPVPSRWVLARAGVGYDLRRPGPGVRWRHGPVRADGHLHGPAAIAGLDDIDLASGGVNAHPETFEVVVPDHALARLAGHGIDGPLGDFDHCALPLAIGYQAPYRYLERASQGA